jgi:hypothetical protein
LSSFHTILEESSDKGDAASGEWESSGSPDPQGCNVVTTTIPITTTLPLENTPALLTIPTVMVRTTTLQPGIGLLPSQQHTPSVTVAATKFSIVTHYVFWKLE